MIDVHCVCAVTGAKAHRQLSTVSEGGISVAVWHQAQKGEIAVEAINAHDKDFLVTGLHHYCTGYIRTGAKWGSLKPVPVKGDIQVESRFQAGHKEIVISSAGNDDLVVRLDGHSVYLFYGIVAVQVDSPLLIYGAVGIVDHHRRIRIRVILFGGTDNDNFSVVYSGVFIDGNRIGPVFKIVAIDIGDNYSVSVSRVSVKWSVKGAVGVVAQDCKIRISANLVDSGRNNVFSVFIYHNTGALIHRSSIVVNVGFDDSVGAEAGIQVAGSSLDHVRGKDTHDQDC